jgi:flagellar basal-body rod modification protein FlgD
MSLDLSSVRTVNELNTSATAPGNKEKELGKTAFLELMIAQVQNQDPLEPAKNEAFIAQLAQFSSVEGIQNLNESMDSMVSTFRASAAVDAAALVGRNVLIPTNQTALNTDGGIGGSVSLTEAVGGLTVTIQNSNGQTVQRVDLGARPPGEIRFNWDGLSENGEPVPQDFYRISAFANVEGVQQQFEVSMPDQVVSVSITNEGLVANLAGGSSVSASQIKEIQ